MRKSYVLIMCLGLLLTGCGGSAEPNPRLGASTADVERTGDAAGKAAESLEELENRLKNLAEARAKAVRDPGRVKEFVSLAEEAELTRTSIDVDSILILPEGWVMYQDGSGDWYLVEFHPDKKHDVFGRIVALSDRSPGR